MAPSTIRVRQDGVLRLRHSGDAVNDLAALNKAIDRDLPSVAKTWPGGWPGQIEICLIDAVLSIRAQYGGPDTGVRSRIARYRAAVSAPYDDLARLAELGRAGLHDILEIDQRTSRRLK